LNLIGSLLGKLLPQQALESLAILGEPFDTLVQFVECHLILQQSPSEFRLVIDISDLVDRCGIGWVAK